MRYDVSIVCHDCKKSFYIGYITAPCENNETFLKVASEHQGHDVLVFLDEWHDVIDGNLVDAHTHQVIIEGYSEYERVDVSDDL